MLFLNVIINKLASPSEDIFGMVPEGPEKYSLNSSYKTIHNLAYAMLFFLKKSLIKINNF